MSIFQRYLRHRAPASTQDDALVNRYLPADALRMAWLANNCRHLVEQNPRRALRQHPGVRDFYAPAVDSAFTDPPTTSQIRWSVTQKDGACCIDLGTFYVWPLPSGRWPLAKLSFTTQVDGGFTLGWVFAVSAGTAGPLAAGAVASDVTTSATWDQETATVDLAGLAGAASYGPTNGIDEVSSAEAGELRVFRAFFGAYNSSNSNTGGSRANVVGITLHLEQP